MTPVPIAFPPTRWSLVGRAPNGDVGLLIERYADCLARYLRLRFPELAPSDADDLHQEVLLHLLEHPELVAAASPRAGGRFRYFLATLALNQARNVLRSRRRLQLRQHVLDERVLNEQTSAAEPEVDQAWQEAVLAAAWGDLRGWAASGELEPGLPDLLAQHLAGTPLRELATAHDLSLATCQRRLARARTRLQQAITVRSTDT
jgi:RNA polymerase sigma factor (sigma-70 family)